MQALGRNMNHLSVDRIDTVSEVYLGLGATCCCTAFLWVILIPLFDYAGMMWINTWEGKHAILYPEARPGECTNALRFHYRTPAQAFADADWDHSGDVSENEWRGFANELNNWNRAHGGPIMRPMPCWQEYDLNLDGSTFKAEEFFKVVGSQYHWEDSLTAVQFRKELAEKYGSVSEACNIMDVDGDAKVNISEFLNVSRGLDDPTTPSVRNSERLFSHMDSNVDGVLSMEECHMRVAGLKIRLKNTYGNLTAGCSALDSDGDGAISQEEFLTNVATLTPPISESDALPLYPKLDQDKDGITTVNPDCHVDFQTFQTRIQAVSPCHFFNISDTDHDSLLTMTEFMEAGQNLTPPIDEIDMSDFWFDLNTNKDFYIEMSEIGCEAAIVGKLTFTALMPKVLAAQNSTVEAWFESAITAAVSENPKFDKVEVEEHITVSRRLVPDLDEASGGEAAPTTTAASTSTKAPETTPPPPPPPPPTTAETTAQTTTAQATTAQATTQATTAQASVSTAPSTTEYSVTMAPSSGPSTTGFWETADGKLDSTSKESTTKESTTTKPTTTESTTTTTPKPTTTTFGAQYCAPNGQIHTTPDVVTVTINVDYKLKVEAMDRINSTLDHFEKVTDKLSHEYETLSLNLEQLHGICVETLTQVSQPSCMGMACPGYVAPVTAAPATTAAAPITTAAATTAAATAAAAATTAAAATVVPVTAAGTTAEVSPATSTGAPAPTTIAMTTTFHTFAPTVTVTASTPDLSMLTAQLVPHAPVIPSTVAPPITTAVPVPTTVPTTTAAVTTVAPTTLAPMTTVPSTAAPATTVAPVVTTVAAAGSVAETPITSKYTNKPSTVSGMMQVYFQPASFASEGLQWPSQDTEIEAQITPILEKAMETLFKQDITVVHTVVGQLQGSALTGGIALSKEANVTLQGNLPDTQAVIDEVQLHAKLMHDQIATAFAASQVTWANYVHITYYMQIDYTVTSTGEKLLQRTGQRNGGAQDYDGSDAMAISGR